MDKALLSIFKNRSTFYRFRDFIKDYTLTDQTKYLLSKYKDYYERYKDSEAIDTESFKTFITHVTNNKADKDKFSNLLAAIDEVDAYDNDDLEQDIINHYLFIEAATEMADLCNQIIDGNDELTEEDLEQILTEYIKTTTNLEDKEFLVSSDLYDLFQKDEDTPGYQWSLRDLQLGCGKVRGGDLICVFARPNVGKTSFIVSESLNLAKQMPDDRQVVWFNNEESVEKILHRYYACALNKAWQALDKELIDQYINEFDNKYFDHTNLLAYDVPSVTTGFVQNELKDLNPGIIVFNNLDKVSGFRNEGNDAMRLAKLYQWARELAKEYEAVVFAVGQAGADAEGAKKLYMDMMDQSKTGKAGEADLIIGIGYDDEQPDKRFISTPKNKMEGGGGNRDVFSVVKFDGDTGRFTDIEKETYGI